MSMFLRTFVHGTNQLRAYGKYITPYFYSSDIEKLSNSNLPEDEKYIAKHIEAFDHTVEPDTKLVNEYTVHRILSSQPSLHQWFVTDVLPSIRTEGIEKDLRNKNKEITRLIASKRRHFYHKFLKGPSLYILSDVSCTCFNKHKYKVGIEGVNINRRLQQHRTTLPALKLNYLIYCKDNDLLEKILLTKYRKNRSPFLNHEWISGVDVEELIKEVEFQSKHLNLEYKVEKELQKYNEQIENLVQDNL